MLYIDRKFQYEIFQSQNNIISTKSIEIMEVHFLRMHKKVMEIKNIKQISQDLYYVFMSAAYWLICPEILYPNIRLILEYSHYNIVIIMNNKEL